MLQPAQLYKEELKRKLIECWYNPKYSYYFGGEHFEFSVPDNLQYRHDFVHIGPNGKVDGFFSYNYNDSARSMTNFGLISFTNDGTPLVMEAIKEVKRMFEVEKAHRAEFWAFADNPVNKVYEYIVKKFKGHTAGYLRDTAFFDGKYHDTIFYEILDSDFIK